MIPRRPAHPVIVVRPKIVDDDVLDDRHLDWDRATRRQHRAEVQITSTDELDDGRDAEIVTATIWLRPADALQATDRVEWRGDVFEVVGPPKVRFDGRGRPDHVEANLESVTG